MQVKGEQLKKAISWVTETKNDFPEKKMMTIVTEASIRFDLNPVDSNFLTNFFKEKPVGE